MDVLWLLAIVAFFILSSINLMLFLVFVRSPVKVIEKSKEKKDKKVSVIIPAYNEEKNIREAIESVISSDYPKELLEVVVVDDGSKDRTYEIAKKYESKTVKVFTKKNEGVAKAKNFGVRKASGEIVITMDADTSLDKNAIKRLVSYFDEEDVAAVTGAVRAKNSNNWLERMQAYEYDLTLVGRRILTMVDCVWVTPGGLSAFRKDILLKVGLFDPNSLTEDQEIAYKIQKLGKKIRTTLDAFAYTVVPKTIPELIKQRVRWVRGGIYNKIKYKDLFHPKYGDFSILGMAYDLIFLVPFTILLLRIILDFFAGGGWFERIGFDVFILSINPLTFAWLILFSLFFPWMYFSINIMREYAGEKKIGLKELPDLISFTFIYNYHWLIVWIIAFIKEITKRERKWETR